MSDTNVGQEVISEEKETGEFQQNGLKTTDEEPVILLSGRELAAFFEATFPMAEQEADLLVGYMEGHNFNLGQKDGVLYRGEICPEERKVKWEPDTIDDVVDAVSEWNFEMMQAAKTDMENPDNLLDFSKKKSYYDSLCEDEKVLDVLFDRTKYGKDLNDLAQKLAEEFIRDLTDKGLDDAIERMKEEVQQGIEQKKGRSR